MPQSQKFDYELYQADGTSWDSSIVLRILKRILPWLAVDLVHKDPQGISDLEFHVFASWELTRKLEKTTEWAF